MTYQDSWPFWLDDACYCIARGVRYLALPSEVDTAFWCEHMQIEAAKMTMHHGVLVRAVGDESVVEIQVAKYEWVERVEKMQKLSEKHPMGKFITTVLLVV